MKAAQIQSLKENDAVYFNGRKLYVHSLPSEDTGFHRATETYLLVSDVDEEGNHIEFSFTFRELRSPRIILDKYCQQ